MIMRFVYISTFMIGAWTNILVTDAALIACENLFGDSAPKSKTPLPETPLPRLSKKEIGSLVIKYLVDELKVSRQELQFEMREWQERGDSPDKMLDSLLQRIAEEKNALGFSPRDYLQEIVYQNSQSSTIARTLLEKAEDLEFATEWSKSNSSLTHYGYRTIYINPLSLALRERGIYEFLGDMGHELNHAENPIAISHQEKESYAAFVHKNLPILKESEVRATLAELQIKLSLRESGATSYADQELDAVIQTFGEAVFRKITPSNVEAIAEALMNISDSAGISYEMRLKALLEKRWQGICYQEWLEDTFRILINAKLSITEKVIALNELTLDKRWGSAAGYILDSLIEISYEYRSIYAHLDPAWMEQMSAFFNSVSIQLAVDSENQVSVKIVPLK